MRWKIWYPEGDTFSSEDGLPWESPGLGVQVIAQEHPDHGRQLVVSPSGYYWWSEEAGGCWYGGDFVGLLDYLQLPGLKCVRFGRSIATPEFRRILTLADRDPWLPPRSAVGREEAPWVT